MRFTDLPEDLRLARPEDYDRIAAVLDRWWGRPMTAMLPRLFLDHFSTTSLVADGPDGDLRGFLVGFASPSRPGEAYIHFVGVAPGERRGGLAGRMYRTFFDAAAAAGCDTVRCVTGPVNTTSIAFHTALGFTAAAPAEDYDGPGEARVAFRRALP